jgi:cytochrome P450
MVQYEGSPDISTPDDVDLLEQAQSRCPWKSYEILREQAPVWEDPRTGIYVISRYEDIRRVLLDTETFCASVPAGDDTHRPEIRALYEQKGMLPATTMNGHDDPLHKQIRGLMDFAFRAKRIELLTPYLKEVSARLVASFLDREDGRIELVADYCAPLTLSVMTHIMGVPEKDGPMIDAWAEAWVRRLSEAMPPEEEMWSCEQEIEAQHYFQQVIDRLREHPDDSLISDMVNGVVPEWGRGLPDNQLHIEILVDMFVGGRALAPALASAILILIRDPELWNVVRGDPDKYLTVFIEEALRTDGPQQGNPRRTTRDVEVAGTVIPEGSLINARWGAGNRDPRQFGARAGEIDLTRQRPKQHLAFGVGTHHCIGNTLARAGIRYGLLALFDSVERLWLLDEDTPLDYLTSFILRGPLAVPVGFEKKHV